MLSNLLFYTWIAGTFVGAGVALACAAHFALQSLKLKSPGHAFRSVISLFAALSLAILNPFVSIICFSRAADREVQETLAAMKTNNIIGSKTSAVVTRYGEPVNVERFENAEYWYYDPTPWFIQHFGHIILVVKTGTVTQAFYDD